MATVEELTIVAKVKDLATQALDKVGGKIKKLRAEGVLDFKKLGNAARDLRSGFMAGVGAATKLAASMAALVTGSVFLSKGFSDAAADAEELSSKFDALFGDNAADARAWAETYRAAVNRGEQATLEALAAMRGFTEGLGLAAEDADALAMELTQLGVDLSSFYNVAQDDAMQRLRSGLIGNAEALDAFAARISETQLKEYAESNGILFTSLTDTEKVLLRLEVLYGKVNKAVGDAERTSGSFQNQMRGLFQGLADVRAELGSRINPAIQDVIASMGGPQGVIDLFKVFGATVAEVAIATAELAGLIGSDLLNKINALGGAEIVVAKIRLAFAELKRDVMAFSLEWQKSLSNIAKGFQILGKLTLKNWGPLLDPLTMDAGQERVMEYQLDLIDKVLGKSREWIALREKQIAQYGSGPPPLPSIPEGAVGPMIGPAAPPEQQTSAVQAYTAAKQAAVAAERAHAQAIAEQGRAYAPLIAAGLQAASAVFSYYNERQAAFNEEQARLAAEAESWRKGNEEIERRRELAANLFPTLQIGWMAAGKAAKKYANEVQQTRLVEAQLTSVANAIVSAFQLMVTETENLSDALKNLVKSLAADLLGTQLRSVIFPMFGLKPFAKGGVIPGGTGDAMPVKGYATGGPIMRSPHVALIGEGQYNEAVVPLPDGRSIPVQMQGGARDGGSTSVEFTVNALDAASVAQLFARNGKELADIVASRFQRSRNLQASLGGGLV